MSKKRKHIPNTTLHGQLEIDHNRGVIYFHAIFDGQTKLRICSLPKPIPKDVLLDITHMYGTSWDPHEIIPKESTGSR